MSDFTLSSTSVMFMGVPMMMCIMVSVDDDAIIEGDHSFTIAITGFGGANAGTITSSTFTIEDNDGKICYLS